MKQKKTLEDLHNKSTEWGSVSMKRWRSGCSKGVRGGSVDSCNLGDHHSSFCTFFIPVLSQKDPSLESSMMMNRKLNEQPLYSLQLSPHTEQPCEMLECTMNCCSRKNVWTDSADKDRNKTSITKAHRGTVTQQFLTSVHGVPSTGRS